MFQQISGSVAFVEVEAHLDNKVSEAEAEIFVDPSDNYFWSAPPGTLGREKLGSVKSFNPHSPHERMCVYCCRHGCREFKLMSSAPSLDQLKAWFRAGLAIPRGKNAATVGAHRGLFPVAD